MTFQLENMNGNSRSEVEENFYLLMPQQRFQNGHLSFHRYLRMVEDWYNIAPTFLDENFNSS